MLCRSARLYCATLELTPARLGSITSETLIMRRLTATLAFLPFLALLASCSDSTAPGGTTDLDVSGDWFWTEQLGDVALGVQCADTGTANVSQDGTHFTAKGHVRGSCAGPGGVAPIDDSIHVTSGVLSGTDIRFSVDGCPYHGTSHGAAPDSADGTMQCTVVQGSVTAHLSGTWHLRRTQPDHALPTATAALSGSTAPASYPDIVRVGDILRVTVHATDDSRLSWVGYTVAGTATLQDSVPVTGADTTVIFTLPVTAPMLGGLSVASFARDAVGKRNYTVPSALTVVNVPAAIADSVTLPGEVADVVYDAKRNRVYFSIFLTNKVAVINPANGAASAPILLPGAAAGLDLSPSGDSLLVGLGDRSAFAVVNLLTGAIDTVHLAFDPGYPRVVGGLRVAANGKVLVTGIIQGFAGIAGQLATYDLTTHLAQIRTDVGDAGGIDFFTRLARLGDGSRIALVETNVQPMDGFVYSSAGDSFGPAVPGLVAFATEVQGSTTGGRFLAGHTVYNQDLTLVSTFVDPIAGAGFTPTALSVDGGKYFVQGALQGLPTYQRRTVAGGGLLDEAYVPGWKANQVSDRRFLALPDGQTLLVYEGSRSAISAPTLLHLVHLP
jgi:hypothetical protein